MIFGPFSKKLEMPEIGFIGLDEDLI